MITTHQYLEKYPISAKSKKLIVGTIHPHNHSSFQIPFFYGNVTSLWKILSQAFPNHLKQPLNLKGILDFLEKKNISVSDTIRKCERKNPTALDKDLIPLELNEKIIDDIRDSTIEEILFTSGFEKNNAFRLFYVDILGLKITSEIRKNRNVMLDKSIFGRPVKLTVLYSPSGTANIGLSNSPLYLESKEKYKNSKKPVADFKVDYYRTNFEVGKS
jgi:G:T/U-mismatch repair DNA glycosylase